MVVVVALGIGVWGAVGAASPGNAANNPTAAEARTLTLLVKTRDEQVVNLKPLGPSQGDIRVVNAPLYDQSGKKKVGRYDGFCVLTDPSNNTHVTQCLTTVTLAGGEISTQGVNSRASLGASLNATQNRTDAITGGTGKYAGVRGEVSLERRGDKVIGTYHLLLP